MSTSRKPTFSEMMARFGFDPRKEHPDIAPPPRPVYLGKGEWGSPDDDGGHDTEDDEFMAELMKDEPPVAAPERPWYDRDG